MPVFLYLASEWKNWGSQTRSLTIARTVCQCEHGCKHAHLCTVPCAWPAQRRLSTGETWALYRLLHLLMYLPLADSHPGLWILVLREVKPFTQNHTC